MMLLFYLIRFILLKLYHKGVHIIVMVYIRYWFGFVGLGAIMRLGVGNWLLGHLHVGIALVSFLS
jgi:hypothetical protein